MKDSSRTILLLVILIIFPLVVANLSSNAAILRNEFSATPGGQTQLGTETSTTKSVAPFQVAKSNPFHTSVYVFAGVVALIAISSILYYYNQKRKKRKKDAILIPEKLTNSKFSQVIAIGLLILLFMAVIEGIRSLAGVMESQNQSSTLVNPLALLQYSALVAIVVGSSVSLFIILRARKPTGIQATPPMMEATEAEQAKEFKSIIDKAAHFLGQGSDYRSTIIDCYREVLTLLERSGMPQKASLTAREFEEEVSLRIGLSSKYLHQVTDLFERARYSLEDLSSSEAESARQDLEKLSSELQVLERKQGDSFLTQPASHRN